MIATRAALRSFAILLVLTLGAAASAQPNLTTWDSRFYEIHTDLPREEVIDYARHMDLVYAEFERRFAHLRGRQRVDQPLYLFASQHDYIQFMATMGVDATNSGGMFFYMGTRGGLATFVDRPDRAQALATLRHEAFHQFAHNYLGPTLPTSINEGIAQYFENIVIVNGRIQTGMADRRRIEQVRAMIKANRALPLDALLNITDQQWHETLRTDVRAASDLYAQSWSLVYFLVHVDGRHRTAFETYLEEISRGRHSRQAMQTAFNTDDFSVAENAWRRFAWQLEPDPITTTQSHLEFLGQGIATLLQHDGKAPPTFHHLRRELRSRGFRTYYQSHGVQFEITAEDDHVFQYERAPGRWEDFEMIEPAASGPPPRLVAPHARWRPVLVWDEGSDGSFVYDVVYQGGR